MGLNERAGYLFFALATLASGYLAATYALRPQPFFFGLMGQARGIYMFGAHLRWSWAIALGYVASVLTHVWVNAKSS